jgi:hypothetical protein
MRRYTHLIVVSLLAVLILCGCETTKTIIIPEGEVAAKLGVEKDKQIAGLVAQIKAERERADLSEHQASLASANFDGILFAREHLTPGLPSTAIEEEAKLGKARLPAADPTELLKAKDRVIAILNGEVEKAKALYGAASSEAARAKATIAAKDQEIAARDKEIETQSGWIADLTEKAKLEREQAAKDAQDRETAHKTEILTLKDDYANKQQQLWLLGIRAVGLLFILGGGLAIIIFKRIPEGALGLGLGLLIGIVSVGFDKLTSAPWFPVAFGVLILIALGAVSYTVYRIVRKGKLHDKLTAAIQDLRDEDAIKGTSLFKDALEPHLHYRIGDKTTSLGKEQAATVISLGLIDPKGEEAIKKDIVT